MAERLSPNFELLLRLEFLHDNPALRVHIHVITVTVLAGRGVVAVSIAFGVDHLIAGHPLQCNGRFEILAECRIFGRQNRSATDRGGHRQCKSKYAQYHAVLLNINPRFSLTCPGPRECSKSPLSRTKSPPQAADRRPAAGSRP